MDPNLTAWLIGGGPQLDDPHAARDREQLLAFRESQRMAKDDRIGLLDRIRRRSAPTPPETDLGCCTA